MAARASFSASAGRPVTRAEAAEHAEFAALRYAQCWEDADTLVEALQPQPGQLGLSVASGGENTLALLASAPERVIAVDLNPAQIACLELKVAAFRALRHDEVLQLVGSRAATDRRALYQRCRSQLSNDARRYWDARGETIDRGIGSGGKFERYFALFRARMLPLVHRRATVDRLLAGGSPEERARLYREEWDTWRWRVMFRFFFSRRVMGRLGRDPAFFRYVDGSIADRILTRTRHALIDLNPADNPYIHWILTGGHGAALPRALRPEHFDVIRDNLDRLEWQLSSVESFVAAAGERSFDWFNLSDIFEYMSEERTRELLAAIWRTARRGARLAYWNTLVPRARPEALADRLRPLTAVAARLHEIDKAFFYNAFVVEEVL